MYLYPIEVNCWPDPRFICRLVFFQEEFEHPTEDDLNRVYHVPLQDDGAGSSSDQSDHLFRHMTEMTILTVQLIVEFSKHLPGFQTLCRDDQVKIKYSIGLIFDDYVIYKLGKSLTYLIILFSGASFKRLLIWSNDVERCSKIRSTDRQYCFCNESSIQRRELRQGWSWKRRALPLLSTND